MADIDWQMKRDTLLRASKRFLLNDFRFRAKKEAERRWLEAVLYAWSGGRDKVHLVVFHEATSWLCLMVAEEFRYVEGDAMGSGKP